MYRFIAVDGQGCHSFTVDISESRYHRPKYLEALYNSIEMVFKKLKYHKGKLDITINIMEVDDVESGTTKNEQASEKTGDEVQQGLEVRLAEREDGIQTYQITNQPGDKGI